MHRRRDSLRPTAVVSTHRGARVRPLLATFDDPALERRYREAHAASHTSYLTASLGLSSLAFLAYGAHDALVVPDAARTAWLIRYGVFVPVVVLTWLALRGRRFVTFHQPVTLLFGWGVCGVVLGIAAVATDPVAFTLYASLAAVFIGLGAFVARMTVLTQGVYAVGVLVGLEVVLATAASPHLGFATGASLRLTMISMGSLGAFAAWRTESMERAAWLQGLDLAEEKEKNERLLLNVLPAPIAARLIADEGTIADAFQEATILFCDIVGFTKLSARMAAPELVDKLDRVFSSFDEVASELGLEKIKTIGDAYMVAGGIPTAREDHVEAVCRMGLRIRAELARLERDESLGLGMRIGIHTGPVVAGVIGRHKFIYDVWGDTVNTASRMESHGEAGRIHVSAAVASRVAGCFALEPRGRIDVKGKGEMETYFLEESAPA